MLFAPAPQHGSYQASMRKAAVSFPRSAGSACPASSRSPALAPPISMAPIALATTRLTCRASNPARLRAVLDAACKHTYLRSY